MSDRKQSAFVEDILQCIERIQYYTVNLSYEQFSANFMAIEACLYNIQVIGESVSRLEPAIKEANPEIPWPLMRGMRNRLIHEYFGTDLLTVWQVITNELPALKEKIQRIQLTLKSQNR